MKIINRSRSVEGLKKELAEIEKLQSVAKKFRDNLKVKRWRVMKAITALEQMELPFKEHWD